MEYQETKLYLVIYKIIEIVQKIIYVIMGLLIPLQVGWSRRFDLPSKSLSRQEIEYIADYIGFSFEKAQFYIDNLMIAITAIIIIMIFKATAKYEEKYTDLKIIKKLAICGAAIVITKMIMTGA